jgi:hypothetical protein
MTSYPEIWAALAAPFPTNQVRIREKTTKSGATLKLSYIDAHHVQDRLDNVLGPENWEISLAPWGADLIATMTITLPDGRRVPKSDVGGRPTGDHDQAKAAASYALRRCAVLFGVGRYLYEKGAPGRVNVEAPARPPAPVAKAANGKAGAKAPQTGVELLDYATSNTIDSTLKGWIVGHFTKLGHPAKIVTWTPAQVALALPVIREHLERVKLTKQIAARAAVVASGNGVAH